MKSNLVFSIKHETLPIFIFKKCKNVQNEISKRNIFTVDIN